jgi:ceramide glucosyltransferase
MRAIIAGVMLMSAAAGMVYSSFAIARTRRFRHRIARGHGSFTVPASILKPLHGDEPGLYANLRSFCEQRYPTYQVIFGAADPNDPALKIARRIQNELPECDIEVIAGRAQPASNPKIGNLLGMIGAAKHPLIVIADSDIRVGSAYLKAVAASFSDPQVGAVTCIYGGEPGRTIASQLGAMFVNDQFAPSVLVAQALEPLTYCFGATMAVLADVLARAGGLQALADHLGDDYLLGNLVTRAGYRVDLCPYVVQTAVSERGMRSLWLREVRWARTIRAARPGGYAGSIVTHVLPLSVLFALISPWPLTGVAAIAIAAALRMLLHEEARKTFAPRTGGSLWLIPVRDFLSVGVWCSSFLGRRVTWREERYRVDGDGRMLGGPEECNDCV